MDIDDWNYYWDKKTYIVQRYGAEFNRHLKAEGVGYITMSEYETMFWDWYNAHKKTAQKEGYINGNVGKHG